MNNQNVKQQIVETLHDVENVLVTVNSNPTVDELTAALGFTLLLNKMEKHATAVFSGAIPDVLSFLEPGKTFENTVDSLRDFIIALDKDKADHLRYKVDGDMVKIFITPYRTTITDQDLNFSQGDYNVEAVVAIGVQNLDDFDKALADHGRIMHDATVAAISIGDLDSRFGAINWHEAKASSYSEVLVELSEALRSDKNLIDEQIATAYLTGVVAATERFSNQNTTSKAMTVAAQLMAAGANQQLIATRLDQAEAEEAEEAAKLEKIPEDTSKKADQSSKKEADKEKNEERNDDSKNEEEVIVDRPAPDGTMTISHEKEGTLEEVSSQVAREQQEAAKQEAEHELKLVEESTKPQSEDLKPEPQNDPEEVLSQELKLDKSTASATPLLDDLKKATHAAAALQEKMDEPSFGGTLNATTEEAAEDARRAEQDEKNHTILSHNSGKYVSETPDDLPAVNSFSQPNTDKPFIVDTFGGGSAPTSRVAELTPPSLPTIEPIESTPAPQDGMVLPQVFPPQPEVGQPNQTLADIDASNRTPHEDARAAIDAALQQSSEPVLPSFDAVAPNLPPAPIEQPATPPALPPLPPPMSSLPDFSKLPPLPSMSPGALPNPGQAPVDHTLQSLLPPLPQQPEQLAPAPKNDDPGQFRIPGQM